MLVKDATGKKNSLGVQDRYLIKTNKCQKDSGLEV